MFSPLSILIKPSKIKRWLYFSVHLIAVLSIVVSSTPTSLSLLLLAAVFASGYYQLFTVEADIFLYWELESCLIKVAIIEPEQQKLLAASNSSAFEQCEEISELHMIFGLLFLRLKFSQRADLTLLIFPDSVDSESYRKLRAAAKWARIKPAQQP